MPKKDNLDQGWVKYYRSILPRWGDLEYWIKEEIGPEKWSPWTDKPPCAGKLWELLLLLANEKGEVKRGLHGLSFWLARWDGKKKCWEIPSKTTLRDWVKKLGKEGMITRQFEMNRLVMKVTNWSAYQRPAELCVKTLPHPFRTPNNRTGGRVGAESNRGMASNGAEGSQKEGGNRTPDLGGASALEQEKNKKFFLLLRREQLGRITEHYQNQFAGSPLIKSAKINLSALDGYMTGDDAVDESEIIKAISAAKQLWFNSDTMRKNCKLLTIIRNAQNLVIDLELSKQKTDGKKKPSNRSKKTQVKLASPEEGSVSIDDL